MSEYIGVLIGLNIFILTSIIYHRMDYLEGKEKKESYIKSLTEYLFQDSFIGILIIFAMLTNLIILTVFLFTWIVSLIQ